MQKARGCWSFGLGLLLLLVSICSGGKAIIFIRQGIFKGYSRVSFLEGQIKLEPLPTWGRCERPWDRGWSRHSQTGLYSGFELNRSFRIPGNGLELACN